MRILRAADHKAMPWKNGGGITREVALAPAEGAAFLWRLSLATIRESGPFSTFAGIDRTIVALRGNAVDLMVDGAPATRLTAAGEPFAFAGEAAVEARIGDGETTDLNIMTLRGHARHVMKRIAWSGDYPVTGEHSYTMVVLTGSVAVVDADGSHMLAADDVIADLLPGDELTLIGSGPSVAYLVGIDIP